MEVVGEITVRMNYSNNNSKLGFDKIIVIFHLKYFLKFYLYNF